MERDSDARCWSLSTRAATEVAPSLSAAAIQHACAAMTLARRISFSACLPLVSALVHLTAAEGTKIPFALDTKVHIEAPSLEMNSDGAKIAPHGFVARMGEKVLIGDALRYDDKNDDLYATGQVVMVMPGVRLHAKRLGLHPKAENGDAWEVEAFVEHAGRRITITAEHVHLDRKVLYFDGIHAISGYGSVVELGARSARVYLRDKPAEDRSGFERQVEGLEMISATVRTAGVPVMWLPYLYRDFYYDYPWTRYEGGKTRRLGYYARAWIGTSLGEVLGWHPRIEARGDTYSRTGETWGMRAAWENPELGKGQITWFNSPHEIVMGGPDELQNVVTRDASVIDAEQQLHGLGGALYGRYVQLPDADPPYPGDPARTWDERFRGDYLRNDLEHRPFARRGVTGTWGTSLGNITLDTERRANPDQPITERLWGVQMQLPRFQISGPLHVGGNSWTESLKKSTTDDAAVRTAYNGTAAVMQWFGPLGIDFGGGVNGLIYQNTRLGGIDLDNQERVVSLITGGFRTRFVGDLGDGLTHVFTPRVGLELYQKGHGDALSPWSFGDTRDRLDEDLHLVTTGFDTSLNGTRSLFHATAVARWGMRDHDRIYTDALGVTQIANTPLVDVVGSLEGSPIASLTLTGNFAYDAQREQWRSFDFGSSWVTSRWMALRYTGSLIPETTTTPVEWQHRPGITLVADRYRLDADTTFRPHGAGVDQWLAQLTRRMVDGELSLTYELVRDTSGFIYDRRFGIGFSMTLGGSGDRPAGTPAPAGFKAQ